MTVCIYVFLFGAVWYDSKCRVGLCRLNGAKMLGVVNQCAKSIRSDSVREPRNVEQVLAIVEGRKGGDMLFKCV